MPGFFTDDMNNHSSNLEVVLKKVNEIFVQSWHIFIYNFWPHTHMYLNK